MESIFLLETNAIVSYVEDAFSCLEAHNFLEIVAEYSTSLGN